MKVIIAGGGTAGHVLPALEVANEIKKRFNKADILFIGSKGGADEKLVPAENYQIRYLSKANFPRKLNLASLTFIPRFSAAIIQSVFLLRSSTLAVGFGGYVATPVYIAARILGIPIAIHEANSVPGLANRVGRKWAKVVAVFNPINNWNDQHVIGFPMRNSIVEAAKLNGQDLFLAKAAARKELGLQSEGRILLVMGGSLGSQKINDAVIAITTRLNIENISILHLIGVGNAKAIDSAGYKQIPYLAKMELAYLAADFVIARAGAGTCAEIEAMGLPAVFIPLSIGNGEQVVNAEKFITRGSAKILLNSKCTSDNLLFIVLEINKSFAEISNNAISNKSTKLSAAADFVDLIDEKILHSHKGEF
ncbi:MAG: UDP-N-acetylglucosamine--N-acetylmuramyl-(pentapeptide) pyrophosphoryl-undecaprenol N-acetylglucosamine transferase [Candidatus Nanopelagicaceae bacterium]|nr:UDP-N-acetylglucosamine--N-acetylmuramyl-(pentapeptide) pyrophosphoryl-undecaprenol N-acetylglucosamine transferase [Candidatus Nanopelagicaceae bacterium]